MNKEKPKRIVIHGCYSALNSDLGIRDKKRKIMKGEHDVFVIAKASKRGYVIVKTITSIENSNTGTFQQKSIEFVKIGRIIPIPIKDINSKKLCGIYQKPIVIHKSKLYMPNNKYKYPTRYNSLLK